MTVDEYVKRLQAKKKKLDLEKKRIDRAMLLIQEKLEDPDLHLARELKRGAKKLTGENRPAGPKTILKKYVPNRISDDSTEIEYKEENPDNGWGFLTDLGE